MALSSKVSVAAKVAAGSLLVGFTLSPNSGRSNQKDHK